MSFVPCPVLRHYFRYNNASAQGGKLYTYLAGTTDAEVVYINDTGTPHTNPVILDPEGSATLYLDSTKGYKFIIKSADDDLIDEVNNVSGATGGDALDWKCKVSGNDSTAGYLEDKITSSSLSKSTTGEGSNEALNLEVAKIPLSASDTTRAYLNDKVLVASPLTKTESTGANGKVFTLGVDATSIIHNNLASREASNAHPANSIECNDTIEFGSSSDMCLTVWGMRFGMPMGAFMRQDYKSEWANGPIIAIEANGINTGMATTWDGGLAMKVKAHGSISKGSVLAISTTLPDGYVTLNPSYGGGAVGVAYHDAVDGEVLWMVVKGRCRVKVSTGFSPTLGQPLVVGNTTGGVVPVPSWNSDTPTSYNANWERAMAKIGVAISTVGADETCACFLT